MRKIGGEQKEPPGCLDFGEPRRINWCEYLDQTLGLEIRNMAKRTETIGVKFSFHSQEGAGTRNVLDNLPQKQHLSNSEPRPRINR